jgi:peptide/nickel transport system permease protein
VSIGGVPGVGGAARLGGGAGRLVAFARNRWVSLIARRLLGLVAILIVLVVATFAIVHLIPGDPARLIAGTKATPQYVQQLRVRLGLEKPLLTQLLDYSWGALRLHFGDSFATGQPVTTVLQQRTPYTLELAGASVGLVLALGIALGSGAAMLTRDGRRPRTEMAFMYVTGLIGAVPSYVAATLLAFAFAVELPWLPVAGADSATAIILPALAIATRPIALMARIVRVETLNVLAQDYMRAATSKRLRAPRIFARYLLPNVMNATLTLGGLLFVGMIGGTIIVENVFAWPGLGTLEVQSIPKLDYPVIQGATLLLGLIVVLVNTLVDIARAVVDPQSSVGGV